MTYSYRRLLLICTVPLSLASCASKKETFRHEMNAWLKANPTGLDYCTILKVPSEIGGIIDPFGGTAFYQPSSAFTDAAKHPILAIEKAGAAPIPALEALVKAGLVRDEPVQYTEVTQSFQNAAGQWTGQAVYHYTTTTRTAYSVTAMSGWQTTTDPLEVGTVPGDQRQAPTPNNVDVVAIPAGTNPMSPAWCGGRVTVSRVTEYTTPAAAMGVVVSSVKAVLTISDLPSWLSDQNIKPAMSAPPQAEYQGRADFDETSNGWEIDGGVRADGLYGSGNGL